MFRPNSQFRIRYIRDRLRLRGSVYFRNMVRIKLRVRVRLRISVRVKVRLKVRVRV